jgi:hypothetical protein
LGEEVPVRGSRIVTVAAVLVVVLVIGIAVALIGFRDHLPARIGRACEVRTETGTVYLNASQMANAATIAAVGIRRDLPERAVIVALATALQESKLENLGGGDRDSVGLFQQRPSQGWGSPEQISDPRYAAGRFYSALVRIRGWEKMRVTVAAQRVQRSAYPEAYEKWSDEASVLAEALTGRVPGAVACARGADPTLVGPAAAAALGSGLRLDWGSVQTVASADVVGVVVAATTPTSGWQLAHWLVAHSDAKNVARVRFGDREWNADAGVWRDLEGDAVTERVVAEVYP